MDDFTRSDVVQLLMNRFVVVIGDSIQRCIYKDLVLLLQRDRYLTENELRKKGERTFLDDELIEGGCLEAMSNGTNYREVRQYKTEVHLVRFYFVTRCYNKYMESILGDLSDSPFPDVLLMNSCLWDITRYGPHSIIDYKENLVKLFKRFSQSLPASCLVIWNTALPISSSARGGFLVPEIDFKTTTLRLDILEANYYTRKIVAGHGFDVLDLHFYLRHKLHMRAPDGIHWDRMAHRIMTNLIISHMSEAWGISLPERRTVFGSYSSAHARNDSYKHLTLDRQPLLQQPMGIQYPVTLIPLPNVVFVPASRNFTSRYNSPCQNVYDEFEWQPYEQHSSYGSASVHSRSRYQPYTHRRH